MGTISPATDLTLLPILKPMLKLPFKYILLFAALSAVVAQSSDFTDDLSNDIESSGREAWGKFKKAPAPAPKEPRIFKPVCKCPACPVGQDVLDLLLQNGCSCKACPPIARAPCVCKTCPKCDEYEEDSEEEEAEVQAIPCRCPSLKCIPCKAPPKIGGGCKPCGPGTARLAEVDLAIDACPPCRPLLKKPVAPPHQLKGGR